MLTGNEPDLVAYWPFEEGSGTTTADLTSSGNHGTLMNGAQWVSSTISPPTPPAAPSGLSAVAVSPTKVQLTWSDNSTSESRFVIERLVSPGTWARIDSVPLNTVTRVVTNLTPSTTHTFRVQAANAFFFSAYTNTADATTPAFHPPTMLNATTVSIDEVRLQWQDNSVGETHFVVERKQGDGAWVPRDTVPANTVDVTVSGLVPSKDYHFQVKALEDAASSAYSNTADARTRDFHPPTELAAEALSFEDVRLQWKDNTEYELGYIVEVQEQVGSWLVYDTLSANSNSCVVGGLSEATMYAFRVKAVKHVNATAYSNITSAKTKTFLPAPINLTATVLSQSDIRLDWEDRSSSETGYEIEQRLEGAGWTLALVTPENAISHTLSGLLADTTYTFRVRAVGDDAASAWSNEAVAGTFTAPLAPIQLQATALSHQAVSVSWQRGSANEMGFEIERRSGDGGWMHAHATGRGSFHVNDEGLEAQTTYWYRVRATNSLGSSPWSAEDSATTFALPLPQTPFGLQAAATGSSTIELTWLMPSPSFDRGFEVQEARTSNTDDFILIQPDAAAGARSYTRTGLQPSSTYFYRIRAVNPTGVSDWSRIVSATTLEQGIDLPGDPFALTATATGTTEIGLAWEMPVPSKEDGFILEQSPSDDEGDFTPLDLSLPKGSRSCVVTGLQPGTTYWYRLRAYNLQAYSQYSNVASATTAREPLSPQLTTAMQAKEALYPGLEHLIGAGNAEMAALRIMFGDYVRGYDEAPARSLIGSWRSAHPGDQVQAAAAVERFTFFEQALGSAFLDARLTPPVEGAWEISRQAAGAPGMLAKNACALALAWAAQRAAMGGAGHPYVDAAMEDLLLPLADGSQTLGALMGAIDDDALATFTDNALQRHGAVEGLTSRSLLSVLGYWQERMAGRQYIPATQPTIAAFAEKCAQLDIGDTRQSAIAKRDGFTLSVRDRTAALKNGYATFAGVCTGFDAAFVIGQAPGASIETFLHRLVQLRPRLVDGMHAVVANASIPVERFLYLTSVEDLPGLDPLPYALGKAGDAIYHPEIPCDPPAAKTPSSVAGAGQPASFMTSPDPAIESDRAMLIALRADIVADDAAHAAAQYDALRASGREMVAAVTRAERPLFGITAADMHRQPALQPGYYGTLARSALLKTRRTVLSVSLADYLLAPNTQKQSALVAEIDSILGTIDGVTGGLAELKTGVTGGMITLPALALGDADIVRDETAGPTKCRLRFSLTNLGGASAPTPQVVLAILTAGVTANGSTVFTFGDLAAVATVGDSLALDIPANVTTVAVSATLRTGGQIVTDRRMLGVPQSTTTVEGEAARPVDCLLHQNHPNPFRPVTTIRFTLTQASIVSLIVTDALGREVARLLDGEPREAGMHSAVFNARGHASGMYFYRLETAGSVHMRKMVVMR